MEQLTAGIDNIIMTMQLIGIAVIAIPLLSMGFKFLVKGNRYWSDFLFELIAVIAGAGFIIACFPIRDAIVSAF